MDRRVLRPLGRAGPDGAGAACRSRPRRRPVLALLGLFVLGLFVLGAPPSFGAVTEEDERFLDYLVDRIGYYDTALRYLDRLEEQPGTRKDDLAAIESRRIDILKLQGRKQEALEKLEEFQRRFPEHARASLASLEQVGAAFEDVARALDAAGKEREPQARKEAFDAAHELFEKRVRQPLDALIQELETEAPESDQARQRRNLAELSRVRFLLLYANFLPQGSERRQATLEEGLGLADAFVSRRAYFPIMRYEALIQKGLYLLELGRNAEAADELSILYDHRPAVDPPYDPALVTAFKELRLKSILFGVRGLNRAGRPEEALQVIEDYFRNVPASDPLAPGDVGNNPDLLRYAELLRLEEAVALAGAGEAREGLDIIHGVIQENLERGEAGETLVTDARKALGSIAARGDVALSGRDFYEAAIGRKADLRFEAALGFLQKGLAYLAPEHTAEYAPKILRQIGEITYTLGRYEQSAVAFEELFAFFPQSPQAGKAASYCLGAINEALKSREETSALAALRDRADRAAESGGAVLTTLQNRMAEASRAIERGDLAGAREIYEAIPREQDGVEVPFYWRARFSAWWMVLLELQSLDGEEGVADRRAELEKELDAAVADLEANIPEALAAGDTSGAAVGAMTLGQIHLRREEPAEAVEALDVFVGPLAGEDTFVTCPALGYLVDAAVQAGREETALEGFRKLQASCEGDRAHGYAALQLARHFEERDGERAAYFMGIYAESPVLSEDLAGVPEEERATTLLELARILIGGGMTREAQQYIDRARDVAGEGELDRELLYLQALILEQRRDWEGVIETLREYIEKHKALGHHYEDPFVWRKLGLAYYRTDGKEHTPANLIRAERCLNNARSILGRGVRSGSADPGASRRYWRWAYQWLQLKLILGRQLDKESELQAIELFIDENSGSGMGGLEEKFDELRAVARRELGRGGAQ